jgi:hypothetical protein
MYTFPMTISAMIIIASVKIESLVANTQGDKYESHSSSCSGWPGSLHAKSPLSDASVNILSSNSVLDLAAEIPVSLCTFLK